VVDGTNVLVVSGAAVVSGDSVVVSGDAVVVGPVVSGDAVVVQVVSGVGPVVSGDAVVVSWKLVVLVSAVVVILPHWHNRAGQKGVT
jgi:hypothetical protein